MRLLIFLTCLLPWRPLPAEELPTLSFLALAMTSGEIWEAEPLYFDAALTLQDRSPADDAEWLRVRVTKVLRSRMFQTGDTVWVDAGTSFVWPQSGREDYRWYAVPRDGVSRLLLFSFAYTREQYREMYGRSSPADRPLLASLNLSGVRLLDRQGNVFVPWQTENPGPYQFYQDTSARWPELLDRAAFDMRRVDTLLALRAIENPWEQNKAIAAWITRHEQELRGGQWEWYRNLPFNWIWSNNLPQQAWEAVLLHHRLFPEDMPAHSEWPELGVELPTPFRDVAGMRFLLEKIRDKNLDPALRGAALRFFSGASQGNDLPDAERTFLFREIEKLYPEMAPEQRLFAIYAASGQAFDYEGRTRVPDALAFFVGARQQASPGYLRNTIAEIVVRHSTAEAWQAVSGNAGRVLVTLSNFYYDSVKQTISFGFYQAAGVEGLYEHPVLELFQTDRAGREINRREMPLPVTYPKIDWEKASLRSYGAASIEVPVRDLPHGEWHFRARGTAGAQRQYRWVSEPAVFAF